MSTIRVSTRKETRERAPQRIVSIANPRLVKRAEIDERQRLNAALSQAEVVSDEDLFRTLSTRWKADLNSLKNQRHAALVDFVNA